MLFYTAAHETDWRYHLSYAVAGGAIANENLKDWINRFIRFKQLLDANKMWDEINRLKRIIDKIDKIPTEKEMREAEDLIRTVFRTLEGKYIDLDI